MSTEIQNSILLSTKKLLGIAPEYDAFDDDIIIHINSTLSVLNQMGVGPKKGLIITDSSTSWDEFMLEDSYKYQMAKTYFFLKVKSLFDPASSSSVQSSYDNMIKEYEWRLYSLAEYPTTE